MNLVGENLSYKLTEELQLRKISFKKENYIQFWEEHFLEKPPY